MVVVFGYSQHRVSSRPCVVETSIVNVPPSSSGSCKEIWLRFRFPLFASLLLTRSLGSESHIWPGCCRDATRQLALDITMGSCHKVNTHSVSWWIVTSLKTRWVTRSMIPERRVGWRNYSPTLRGAEAPRQASFQGRQVVVWSVL